MSNIKAPKKLIEVNLPLDEINAEAAREKSIRHGHPSTLHLWWARRPLAAARAVLFAQMVNDPGGERGYKAGLTRKQAAEKREELFKIIRKLVKWENVNNVEVLNQARAAIMDSWRETCELNKGKPGFDPNKLPAFHDPFAGGGTIPLEAQRLGLESYATDLNPVAVLINKAMIEIPPKFANMPPVCPVPNSEKPLVLKYHGAQGLAEDIRRYGYWMREEAKKRIGNLFPEVEITKAMVKNRPDLEPYLGQKLTVIAWLWARTVKSPNPRYSHIDVPLVSNFIISKKKGNEAYVQAVIKGDKYHFEVKVGKPPKEAENGTKLGGKGSGFKCILSETPIDGKYIKIEAQSGRMGKRLMAIVCEGNRGRVYISPIDFHESILNSVTPKWKPIQELQGKARDQMPLYGMNTYGDLFTNRQLVALNTFSELVGEARKKAISDAKKAGMSDDGIGLEQGGISATAYGDAIATYLAFSVSRISHYWSNISAWHSTGEKMQCIFARQAIPMVWDFAECNVFSEASGNWNGSIDWIKKVVELFIPLKNGHAIQNDAQTQNVSNNKIVSTDPPYYDNICYADLSDFFYVWLRKNLKSIYPSLFATMATPKSEELIANQYRHDSKESAEIFFLNGMTDAMHNLAQQIHPAFPITIYYAFKSSETNDNGISNTGWETFLEALIKAGFVITGTWPMRTEMKARALSRSGTNALASSIVLVCRRRDEDAPSTSRRNYRAELDEVMPEALFDMTEGTSIAPVDLNQAAIGPGMEIFSKYKSIIKPDGTPLTVHEAMIDIYGHVTRFLNPDDESSDAITNFCKVWFEQNSWNAGEFGQADVLARSKSTSVDTVQDSGVATAKGGKVQLIHWKDYPEKYDPAKDLICSAWETCHHLIRLLNKKGTQAAGLLLAKMPQYADSVRQLAYRQYDLCEKKGLAEDAGYYKDLLNNWELLQEVKPPLVEKEGNIFDTTN